MFTQCLQRDFVEPIGHYDPLPNRLHVGYSEAKRLMGEDPREGPVAAFMRWAYSRPVRQLAIVHVRDWHDPSDPFERAHFRQFGEHCVRGTPGAEFAFDVPDPSRALVVDSLTLNDFFGTGLERHLRETFGDDPGDLRVGVVGVWTEAKVTFLCYDLLSRWPNLGVAVCGALTASSSRTHHFFALEQLERLLGVRVVDSVGEFAEFLASEPGETGGDTGGTSTPAASWAVPPPSHSDKPEVVLESDVVELSDVDFALVRHLFRDCKSVALRPLTGGYSGNLVLATRSVNALGHEEVPHVLKVGPQGPIGKERAAFERVESVLGNNAPQVAAFADFGGRGAIKYRYAAMGGGSSRTFQRLYCEGAFLHEVKRVLDAVFLEQLGRFYRAATLERCNLLETYGVVPDYAESIRKSVEALLGTEVSLEPRLRLPTGQAFPNPHRFYAERLPALFDRAAGEHFFSFVHGDLNGANVVVDSHGNVWLIDFFHTGPSHILRDLVKLENDLLYIFTSVNGEGELAEALALTDFLLGVEDLAAPLPPLEETPVSALRSQFRRAYLTIRHLRSYYPALVKWDRSPFQLLVGQVRYAGHTLAFDEPNRWQKLWALHAFGSACERLATLLEERGPIRVDWLPSEVAAPGNVGITILPGRKDRNRSLPGDVRALKEQGVTHVLVLLSREEIHRYGVEGLFDAYAAAGLAVHHLPVLDQSRPSVEETDAAVDWMEEATSRGGNVLVHCVGGLGRSGVVAACFLVRRGFSPDEALRVVREARSKRAVENEEQERFVRRYSANNS
ncbi:MAG: hypothetical protein Kow0069_19970 [Promethearchaeota archaeon]